MEESEAAICGRVVAERIEASRSCARVGEFMGEGYWGLGSKESEREGEGFEVSNGASRVTRRNQEEEQAVRSLDSGIASLE